MTDKAISQTVKNLEAAFAGESMANRKYLFFARRCRELGANEVAEVFEHTAAQETEHALALSVEKMLEMAIEGETYEYTEMYPAFRHTALEEKEHAAVSEIDEQIEESKEHAERFTKTLEIAEKRFAALTKIEQRHANKYRNTLEQFSS